MTSNNQNHKTVNLSCRIDKEVYDLLSDDAKAKGISINSLVNSIAKRHLTWERFADEIGFIPITKRTIKKIFRQLDDQTINKIAKDVGGTVPRELIYLTYDKMDFENLMKVIEINGTRFGKVKHTESDHIHNINIHHGICENFSKFLAATHQALADDLSLKMTVNNLDNSMVCLEIESPRKP